MAQQIFLIDVSSLFFRSFYAIRNLTNSKGLPTNAIYGLTAAIVKILKDHKPAGVAFCLDRPEAGIREEMFPDYKANRKEPPEELAKQFPYIRTVAEAFDIPCYDFVGYEADDIIGTLVSKASSQGFELIIVSGDKDFGQLVHPGVKIFDPAKDIFLDSQGVKEKFGVGPEQVIDYLALVGDSSDNVPGVSGIGPKGALKLLAEFKTLENLYGNLDSISNEKLRNNLASHKEDAFLSKRLVTIFQNAPVDFSLEEIKLKGFNKEKISKFLTEMEFKSLLQRLVGNEPAPLPAEAKTSLTFKVSEISSLKDLGPINSKVLWIEAGSFGISVSTENNVYRYMSGAEEFKSEVLEVLQIPSIAIAAFDSKTLIAWLGQNRVWQPKIHFDVILAAYCLGETFDLDFASLVEKYLNEKVPEFLSSEQRLLIIRRLHQTLVEKLNTSGCEKVFSEIEMPLIPILFQMENKGVMIDIDSLGKYSKELLAEEKSLEQEIFKLGGIEFNLGSPKQLAQVLFDRLKLPVIRKTKTGLSTDSEVLEKLSSKHPICQKIIEWRELAKLRSTYVDALPHLVQPQTGRVHTHYNQAITSTGRLSSSNPNLQNIPIRTPKGQKIREFFVAPKGFKLVSADYNQIELRILAHITGDKGLHEAFHNNWDIHQATASQIFNVPMDKVTSEQRRASKAINFGIVYGMSDFGLSESLGVDLKTASDFITQYFTKYSGVKTYMREVIEGGKTRGYVSTIFGRRRSFPGLNSSNARVRAQSERAAINMPIQGASADLIKMAMIEIQREVLNSSTDVFMIMQVHDELVFEIRENLCEEMSDKIRHVMENVSPLTVPLKVSISSGDNWGEAH